MAGAGPRPVRLVTDAVAALGSRPAGRLGRRDVPSGDGVRLADGTLAGSVLTLDAAVRNLIEFTGCTAQAIATDLAAGRGAGLDRGRRSRPARRRSRAARPLTSGSSPPSSAAGRS